MAVSMMAAMLIGCGEEGANLNSIDASKYVTTLFDYKGVELAAAKEVIDDEYIDSYIDFILSQYPNYVEVTDRPVGYGDTANIDYVGKEIDAWYKSNYCNGDNNAFVLPEYDNNTTLGILVLDDGSQIPFSSGNPVPKYKTYVAASHAEGKAAIYMRENGINNGIIFHNNTGGTCPYCNTMLPTLLENESTLTVVPPYNSHAPKPGWVDITKTYIGNANIPKTSI